MSKIPAEFKEKWNEIAQRNYAGQACWILNGFWDELQGEAETIYQLWQKMVSLDIQNKKEGRDLDEFYSHKFLETLGETLTVIALRERLRQIDLDNNNRMSFLEYLVFRYKKTVKEVVTSPQGDNKKEIEEATQLLESAQQALEEMQRKLDDQKRLLDAQKQAERVAENAYKASEKAKHEAEVALEAQRRVEQEVRDAEEEVRKAEEEVRKAEAEVKAKEDAARAAENENKAALAELHKQEEDYKNKIAALEKASQEGTVVQKNKAANELAQLKGEDPLPLRKAKITQESAVRKAEKARKEAEQATAEARARTEEAKARTAEAKAKTEEAKAKTADATAKAEEAKRAKNEAQRTLEASKQARLEAEESTRQVEAATKEAEEKFQAAQDFLEEAKKKVGSSKGDLWWLDREIKEAKKYLPKSKQ